MLLQTKAIATAIKTTNIKFVQNELLHPCPNKKLIIPLKLVPVIAQITAKITAIKTTISNTVLRNLCSFRLNPSSPLTNPQINKTTNTITREIVRNKIRLLTINVGERTVTKIRPIIKEIRAFSCLLSFPRTFVFSSIAKTMKNINKNGRINTCKNWVL